jgi:transposase InsO family protein
MTLAGKSRSIFSDTSLKLLQNSKNSKQKLKNRGKYIKFLRSDGGGEYNSNEFSNFCKSQGIIMQTTTRYTPQQNGVAERKNQTIMNMAISLLKEKCLPNTFWAEVVACLAHLLNRSPTTSVKMKVPQEAWSGTKLNVAHLRTFGCITYAHIPSELRKKLDVRSEKCIFTG